MKQKKWCFLSVIVPFFNESKNLPLFHKELVKVLGKFNKEIEIIYVDDGSTDGSENALKIMVKGHQVDNVKVKLVSLGRHFGQTAAIAAGIVNARGLLLSFLDADLQNDPTDLITMRRKINEGYDVVVGWRKKRKDTIMRKIASVIANQLIRLLFHSPFHDIGCSMKMMKRNVMDGMQLYGESHRIVPMLLYWKGMRIAEVVVKHRERFSGHSKYGYSRIIKVIIDLLTAKFLISYATKPAYVFGTVGIGSGIAGFFCLTLVAYRKLFLGVYVHRDPLFLIAIFFILIGIQFMLMGLLAEILIRTYFESQAKLTYDIKKNTIL